MKTETRTIDCSEIAVNAMPGIALSMGMALLIALSARASFMTLVSPVPVTLQTGAVILAGLLLGPRWGAMSVIWYLGAGLMGAPVFAMGVGGPAVVMQPSFGYLLSFPISAMLAGILAARFGKGYLRGIAYGLIAIALIYLVGGAWLAGFLATGGMGIKEAAGSAVTSGMAPFVFVDILKVLLAAGIWCVIPHRIIRSVG